MELRLTEKQLLFNNTFVKINNHKKNRSNGGFFYDYAVLHRLKYELGNQLIHLLLFIFTY
jgi:hypothetical protein